MFFRLFACMFAAVFAIGAVAQPRNEEPASVERDLGGDRFAAGGALRIAKPVGGDLFAAAGNVDVDAPIGGDAIVAGGNVRIGSAVAHSLYAAGGQLLIDAAIGHNARVAGGQVEIGRRAQVDGNVSVAGGEVKIEGGIKGYLRAGGGKVLIDAPIGGDVVSTAGSIELGPNARISGKLRYASREEIIHHPAAQVAGGVERMQLTTPARDDRSHRSFARGAGWAWTIGLLLIAAVLVAALPEFGRQFAETLRARPAICLLAGFIALVCIPVAAFILLFTVIGIPLALLTVVAYLALLLLGYVTTGIAVGDWTLRRFGPAQAQRRAWRVAAAAAGVLSIALLGRLPWIGGLFIFVAILAGIGTLLMQTLRRPPAI